MKLEGRCYCGNIHYVAEGEPMLQAQCHCRECQYITGGAENLFVIVPAAGFRYTEGEPKRFARSDLETPATREFCGACGTHLTTRPHDPNMVIVKVGTLDDPAAFEGPQMVIWTKDAQPYHLMPEGVPRFEGFPGR